MNMPILNDLILNTFIPATIMHTANISLIIQLPLLNQYNTVTTVPTLTDIRSKILTLRKTFVFMVFDLASQMISPMQIVTPIIPTTVPTIFRDKEIILGMK